MVLSERALRRLHPQNSHAFRLPGAIGQVISALSLSFERLRTFLKLALVESVPYYSTLTLPAWMQALGLTYDQMQGQAYNQAAADAAWANTGGQSLNYLNSQIQKQLPGVYIQEVLYGSNMGTFYPNWIANGNCEAGVPTLGGIETPTGATFAQSSAQAHGGTYSALFTKTAGPGSQGYLNLGNPAAMNGLTPGHTYSLTFWIFIPGGGFPATDIALYAIANSAAMNLVPPGPIYNSWQQVSMTFTVPATAMNAYLQFVVANADGNYTFYIDDMVLNDMSVPPVITFADIDARMNVGHVGVMRMNAADQSMTYLVLGTVATQTQYNLLLAILAQIAPAHLYPNIQVTILNNQFLARMNVAQLNNARVGKGS